MEIEVIPEDSDDEGEPAEGSVPLAYPGAESIEEQRRAFIFERMADADIKGDALVENMALVEAWLKTGAVPSKDKDTVKRKLKVVE